MTRQGRRAGATLLLALALTFTLLPAAEAQTGLTPTSVDVRLDPAMLRLVPLGGAAGAEGVVEVRMSTPSAEAIDVDLAVVQGPAWADVRLHPDVLRLEPVPGEHVLRGTFLLEVRADERAPAFQPTSVLIEATSRPTVMHAGARSEASIQLVPEYYSLLDVQVEQTRVRVAPDVVTSLPVTVTNRGNGNARVWIEVLENPQALHVQVPPYVVLQSLPTGGSDIQRTLAVRIGAPESFRSPGDLTLVVRSAYALEPRLEGEPVPLELTVTGRGGGAPVVQPTPTGNDSGATGESQRRSAYAPAEDDSLLVQTGWGRSRDGDEGAGLWPWSGALVGGLAGFVLARRRLLEGTGP